MDDRRKHKNKNPKSINLPQDNNNGHHFHTKLLKNQQWESQHKVGLRATWMDVQMCEANGVQELSSKTTEEKTWQILALDCYFREVIFKINNLGIINMFKEREDQRTTTGCIISNSKKKKILKFKKTRVSFTP